MAFLILIDEAGGGRLEALSHGKVDQPCFVIEDLIRESACQCELHSLVSRVTKDGSSEV